MTRRSVKGRRWRARWLRAAAAMSVGAAMFCGAAKMSIAQDITSAKSEIDKAPDFRLRVSAALLIGRSRPAWGLAALLRALHDPHPAVRVAAAAGLEALRDPAAIPTLEQRAARETSPSVAAQMRNTVASLRRTTSAEPTLAKARYVVQLGNMKNGTNVRGEDFSVLMRIAAKTHAATLPGAFVAEPSDTTSIAQAGQRHIPVLLLDGTLMRLAQGASNGNVTFQAQVEFSVRRVPEQTLRGTLSGVATSFDSVRVLANRVRVAELQNEAVGGAVESAMRGAGQGLISASK
jgi:hypothetical protein